MTKESIALELELDQVDYLIDDIRHNASDDPFLQAIADSIHEQTYS